MSFGRAGQLRREDLGLVNHPEPSPGLQSRPQTHNGYHCRNPPPPTLRRSSEKLIHQHSADAQPANPLHTPIPSGHTSPVTAQVSELAVLRRYPPRVPGDRPHSVPFSKRIPRKQHWQPGASGLTGDRPAVTAGSAVRLEFPRRWNLVSKPEPGQVDTSSKPSHGKGDLPERRARALTASCRAQLSAFGMRKVSFHGSTRCLLSALARLHSPVLLGTP